MDVLKFENQNWKEIPKQDNPTWDYIEHPENGSIRRSECIIVCKTQPYESCVGSGGYSVIHVPKSGDVTRKGLFWDFKSASVFADALAELDADKQS